MDNQKSVSEIEQLKVKLKSANLPSDLFEKANQQIERILLSLKYRGNLSQIDITKKYIDWICNLPWDKKTEDNLDLNKVKETLDKNHYGMENIKKRVLEYISLIAVQKKNLNTEKIQAPSLLFIGLV